MPFQDLRRKPVDHFVVPVGVVKEKTFKRDGKQDSELIYESFGTAFFIGSSGFLITASHVIDQMTAAGGVMVILISIEGQWTSSEIEASEKHDREDVGILKLKSREWYSIMELSGTPEYQTCRYRLWGYPEHISQELRLPKPTPSGAQLEKPELIVNMGYIKRRISREFDSAMFVGRSFYDLSEVAGAKCSGSPIVREATDRSGPAWKVIGVYVGEVTSNWQRASGYAVRTDGFLNWCPELLGRSVFEEKASIVVHG